MKTKIKTWNINEDEVKEYQYKIIEIKFDYKAWFVIIALLLFVVMANIRSWENEIKIEKFDGRLKLEECEVYNE